MCLGCVVLCCVCIVGFYFSFEDVFDVLDLYDCVVFLEDACFDFLVC